MRVTDYYMNLRDQQRVLLHLFLIVLSGAAVYANTLHVPLVLDDYNIITTISQKSPYDHLLHGSARRIADATFALNYRLHGLQVPGYHLVNLLIHLSTAVSIYFISLSAISALTVSDVPAENDLSDRTFIDHFIPLAIALLFVVHPIQTQAVTYTVQRYTSLATFFYVMSVLLFLRGRISYDKNGNSRYSSLLWCASLLSGILALGSKQIAATLPLMLLFLELFLFKGRLLNRRFLVVCCGILSVAVTVGFVMWHDNSWHKIAQQLHQATAENIYMSRSTYFFTQVRVVATYLRLLVLPYGQCLMPDPPVYWKLASGPVMASLVLHICVIATALLLFLKSRNNFQQSHARLGTLQRLAALGIAWFYTAMLVESSVFPITDAMFEHRIYLPSIGFFMTVAALAALVAYARRRLTMWVWGMLPLVCIVLGVLTIARNQIWNDTLVLWEDTVAKSPKKALALANLAEAYFVRNMPEKALMTLVQAIELKGDFEKFHLGEVLQDMNLFSGRFTTGKEYFGKNGKLDEAVRNNYESVISNTLGLAYEYLGKPHNAKNSYLTALLLNPANDLAWYNMGLLAFQLGDTEQARNALTTLGKLNPSLADSLKTTISR